MELAQNLTKVVNFITVAGLHKLNISSILTICSSDILGYDTGLMKC